MRSATKKRIGKDPKRREWIRSLPCVCCWMLYGDPAISFWQVNSEGFRDEYSTVEAAHVGKRGLSQKCSDAETAPLCGEHHRTGKDSAHRLGKRFWEHWGIDKKNLLAELQAAFENREAK